MCFNIGDIISSTYIKDSQKNYLFVVPFSWTYHYSFEFDLYYDRFYLVEYLIISILAQEWKDYYFALSLDYCQVQESLCCFA